MNDILDLDALAPEPKRVKINGEVVECYPPKMFQLIRLQKLFLKLQQNGEDADLLEQFRDALYELVPSLKESNADLSFQQLTTLLSFLQESAVADTPRAEIVETHEKKGVQQSAEQ